MIFMTGASDSSGAIKMNTGDSLSSKSGDIEISSGLSSESIAGQVSIISGSGASVGSVMLRGGDALRGGSGGDVLIHAGVGSKDQTAILLSSSSGSNFIKLNDDGIDVSTKTKGSKISISVPLSEHDTDSNSNSVIQFGLKQRDGSEQIGLRLQSSVNRLGADSSLLTTTAP